MNSSNKRILKNSFALYIHMFIVMGVTLFTSRVVLKALGVEDFGIYNVVGGIVFFFAFMNGAMSRTTQRFVALELGKGDKGDVVSVFSSCVTVHLLIALVVFVLAETLGLYVLNHMLVIPENRIQAAFWVYQFSILSCIVMIISTPYNGAIVAHEKMMAFAYIAIIDAILRLIVAYAIIYDYSDRLVVYSGLLFLVQVITRLYYNYYCHFFLPHLKFKLILDYRKLKDVMVFSGWTLFDNFSIISCSQGINIVLNMFFSPAVNAARSIAGQVENAVKSFSMNFQTSTYPQITKSYSSGEMDRLYSLLFATSKYSFFLLLLVSFPIFIETKTILQLWLGIPPTYSVAFVRVSLVVSLINVFADPLAIVVGAMGKIKYFQMYSGIAFVSILPISFVLFLFYKDPILIFYVYLLISIIVLIFKLTYIHRELGLPIYSYCLSVIIPSIRVTIISVLFFYLLKLHFGLPNILELFSHVIFYIFFLLIVVLFVGISKSERNFIKGYLRRKINAGKD